MIGAGRREMGFSQDELADVLERDASDIALWEAGLEVPSSPSAVMELAAALNLDADELLEAAADADLPDPISDVDAAAPEADEEQPASEVLEAEPDDPVPDDPEPDDPEPDEYPKDHGAVADRPESSGAGATLSRLGSRILTRTSAPSPGQIATARAQMPAPPPSYMDDAQLMRLYRLRLIATAVAGIVLLWLFFWALGNMLDAVGVLWGSLRPGGS